jgi:hypothetical protein
VDFRDRTLTCRECNGSFIWTAGEQQFYQEKGLVNVPARCPDCRANRKSASVSTSAPSPRWSAPSAEP